MTRGEVRRLALALPEATEAPHFAAWSFRVRGKIFATVPPDGGTLHIFVDADAVRAAVGADPASFEELRWGKKLAGVKVSLAAVRQAAVRDLLEASWRARAPKKVAAAFDAHSDGRARR